MTFDDINVGLKIPFSNIKKSKSHNNVKNLNVDKVLDGVVLWKPYYYTRRRSTSFLFQGNKANIIRNYYKTNMNSLGVKLNV